MPEALTGVGWYFSASHKDRRTNAIHGHTWEVTAWYVSHPACDAVVEQAYLRGICEAHDHTILPDHLSRAEDIAADILDSMPSACVEVEVRRPAERLYARARR